MMIFLKILFTQLIGSCTVLLKVADEMVSRQPVLRRQHFLFAKPPKNHRQCPAVVFSFLGRADHIAAHAPGVGPAALIPTERVSIKSRCTEKAGVTHSFYCFFPCCGAGTRFVHLPFRRKSVFLGVN
jgi:hypothetical protein